LARCPIGVFGSFPHQFFQSGNASNGHRALDTRVNFTALKSD
jgi:hypothetical protein